MKKTLLGSLILLAFAGNVQAAANAETSGKVTFFGKVVENTCKVKTDSKNMSVVLNDVGKNHLKTKKDTAMPTPFTINLENCSTTTATNNKPVATKVGAYFYSWKNADENNEYTLKNTKSGNDAAQNVNIQLFDANGTDAIEVVGNGTTDFTHSNTNGVATQQTVNKNHISGKATINGESNVKLHYIARYYATAQAEAGKVESSVDFQIAYE
ncbi:fimbrial protein [Haemophilus influenzae]|uniref:fimbrial protein n=1 Tax=Haemophilus influenzae TaxID=727 RepID=UPI003D2EBE12